MKKKIQDNLPDILKDIKSLVLEKYGLADFHVSGISFSMDDKCKPGYHQVCKNFGKDSQGRPIIVCNCVKNNSGI